MLPSDPARAGGGTDRKSGSTRGYERMYFNEDVREQ